MNFFKNISRLSLGVGALAAASGLSFSTTALAQAMLEEITVTARKREESLQEIPVAATVFTDAALELRSATDMADITNSVPNMSYQDRAGGHQTSIGIRGISSNVRNIGLEDSVGIYVDGVYIGRPMFYNIDLADVGQIEVLRGPQGTLFGKNTIAGALNVTSKQIPQDFAGKIAVTAGNYGLLHLKGSIAGQFSDTVGGSLSVVKKDTDGYVDNLFDGSESQALDQSGIAGRLQFNPGDNSQITLAADYSEKDNLVVPSHMIIPGGSFAGIDFGDGPGGVFGGQYDAHVINENRQQTYEEEVTGFSATLEYDFANDFSLTAIAATRQMDLYAVFDDDNSSVEAVSSYFRDDADQTSLELRLTSPGGQTFDWLVGVFYYDQGVESNRLTQAFGSLDVFGNGSVDTESIAVYFSGDYHITDRLDLNIGLRYTDDSKEAVWSQSGNGAPAFGLPVIVQTGDESWGELSPTLALTYAVSDDVTVYGKASRGFKGGGFMTDLIGLSGFQLEPETVTSYELGLKSVLADNRLRLNAAIFTMDYEDLQTIDLIGLQFVGANAAEATINGLEVDLNFLATENFMINAGFGYSDTEADSFIRNVNGTAFDLSGNKLRNAPELTSNLLLEYTFPMASGAELSLVGEWSFQDEKFYNADNGPASQADDYSLFNARVNFVSANDTWRVGIWGKNLGDEEYITFKRSGPFGQESGLYGEPATYGIDISYNF